MTPSRHWTLDEWLALVAVRKAEMAGVLPRVKRTRPRDPEKAEALMRLALAQMRRRESELFEVVGERRFRLRPS